MTKGTEIWSAAEGFFASSRKPILRMCFLGIVLLAMTSGKAWADNITVNNGGSIVMGDVYVGPYNFTDNTTGQTLQLVCDTFANEVFPPETWNAAITTWSNVGTSLGNPLLNSSSMGYQEVAFLTQEIFNNLSNTTMVGELQWALWEVFDPTGVTSSAYYASLNPTEQTQIGLDLSYAEGNYSHAPDGSYSNIVIYSPTNGWPGGDGKPQEYIGIVSTPEPSSFLLLGVGLMGLIMIARSKKSGALEQA